MLATFLDFSYLVVPLAMNAPSGPYLQKASLCIMLYITAVTETKKKKQCCAMAEQTDTLWAIGLAYQHTFLQVFPVHYCLGD